MGSVRNKFITQGDTDMEKYKVLIAGKNKVIIDDIFSKLNKRFEIVSTSTKYADMEKHLNVFEPQIFMYCALNEAREDILRIVELKRQLTRQGVVFVLIGKKEDCEFFKKLAVYMVDITLIKPANTAEVEEAVVGFMKKKEEEEKALQEEMKRLEEIKEQKRRKHILIIDDDPSVLRLIKEYLHEDYDVATAISGKIAYKFLAQKKTDLILLDYEMPNEKGPQVLENMRKDNQISGVPVIFLTGISEREMITKALRLRPQGYLLKPIDKEKLIGTIEKFIG